MTLAFDEICIDAHDITALGAWWAEVLGWEREVTSDGDVVLYVPTGAGPNWLFVPVLEDKVVKNRIHFDFRPDAQRTEVERVVAWGRRRHRSGDQTWVVRRSRGHQLHPRSRRTRLLTRTAEAPRRQNRLGSVRQQPSPPSRPIPDCLKPPKAPVDRIALWPTVPERNRAATSRARPMGVNTEVSP
jgi:hypothetical protein